MPERHGLSDTDDIRILERIPVTLHIRHERRSWYRACTAHEGLSDSSRCWIRATLRLYLENRAVVRPTVVIDPKQITGVVAH